MKESRESLMVLLLGCLVLWGIVVPMGKCYASRFEKVNLPTQESLIVVEEDYEDYEEECYGDYEEDEIKSLKFDYINNQITALVVTGDDRVATTTSNFSVERNEKEGTPLIYSYVTKKEDEGLVLHIGQDFETEVRNFSFMADLDYVQVIKTPVSRSFKRTGEEEVFYRYELQMGAFYNEMYIEKQYTETDINLISTDYEEEEYEENYCKGQADFLISEEEHSKVKIEYDLLNGSVDLKFWLSPEQNKNLLIEK